MLVSFSKHSSQLPFYRLLRFILFITTVYYYTPHPPLHLTQFFSPFYKFSLLSVSVYIFFFPHFCYLCDSLPCPALSGGGNIISENLVFNTCRESSDHGPFNSWDRQPFLTMERDGVTPSLEPAYNNISFNMMTANYGADGGCIDNDDGSSW